ncbi:perforin-1-like [Plectropomus leopardus]|uniref:perforin-1-like n=1 Tax=Plectropomus leopardus TaxID=160734 RepID=UPI001C4D0214|nr:perforin-1-like [Plectropomus leopardus]
MTLTTSLLGLNMTWIWTTSSSLTEENGLQRLKVYKYQGFPPDGSTSDKAASRVPVKTQLKMKLAVFACLLLIIPFQAEAESCVGKRVNIYVIDGSGLAGDGVVPDPYVTVQIGSEKKRTMTVYSNANPVWYQKIKFPTISTNKLTIEVWDEDHFSSDDKLGTCVQELDASGADYRKVECKMANKKGLVTLHYKCK